MTKSQHNFFFFVDVVFFFFSHFVFVYIYFFFAEKVSLVHASNFLEQYSDKKKFFRWFTIFTSFHDLAQKDVHIKKGSKAVIRYFFLHFRSFKEKIRKKFKFFFGSLSCSSERKEDKTKFSFHLIAWGIFCQQYFIDKMIMEFLIFLGSIF